MRILCVSGENLASFEGRFEVDFASPPLANASLFAICGPTGSGKSTLLDAICLALYDRIPRFAEAPKGVEETSSQDPRQILRRGCGQGWACVLFADGSGQRYEARWSVRRAGGRSAGALQPQQMCLIDVASGQILCDKRKETKEHLQRILGMNFDQFRRSVLLAQGEFASFIKADLKDRAILLEAITGTALYAEVGRRAYEHHKAMQARGSELTAQLQQLSTLSGEERAQLEKRVRDLEGKRLEKAQEKSQMEHRLELTRQMEEWSERGRQVAAALESAQRELGTLEPARRRLALREGLNAHWEPWLRCRQLKEDQRHRQEERNRLNGELEGNREALELAMAQSRANEAELSRHLECWQGGEALRHQAQELEEEVAGLSLAVADLDGQWSPLQAGLRQAEASLAVVQAQRGARAAELENHRLWAEQNNFAELLHQRERDLQRLQGEWPGLCQKGEMLERALKLLEQEEIRLQHLATELQERSELQEQQRRELLERRESLSEDTPPCSMRELQQRQGAGMEHAAQLERAWERAQAWGEVRRRLASLSEHRASSSAVQARDRQECLQVQEESVLINARLEEVLQALEMAQSRRDLTQYRHVLRPGEPCPLCGSPDHPYAAELPVDALEDLRARAHQLTEQSRCLLERRSALDQALKQGEAHLAAQEKEELEQRKKEGELAATLAEWLQPDGLDEGALQAARQVLRDDLTRVRQQIEEVQRHQEALTDLARQEASFSVKQEELLQQARKSQEDQGYCQAQKNGRRVELQGIEEQKNRLLQLWHELLPQGGIQQGFAGTLSEENLRKCSEWSRNWASHQQAAAALRAELEEYERRHMVLRAAHDHHLQAASANRTRWEELSRRATERKARLAELLGGKSVRELEQAHFSALDALREQGHAFALKRQEAQKHSELLHGALERMNQELAGIGAELQTLEVHLSLQFSSRGLSWQDACELFAWPEEERVASRSRVEELSQRLAVLTARGEETRAQGQKLAAELGEPEGEPESVEQIQEALLLLEEERRQLDIQLLEASVLLQADGERQTRRSQMEQDLQDHAAPMALAEELCALIGSANGDKFRKFAQGLTLQQLVEESNHHLAQLAPRYRLAILEGVELDLSIQDTYMADEQRNLASLSGGETFLVSLALALGLSELSSSRASLGSLFVDEGFGSLDGHTLDEAMSALENLQATGRQVGIISHVDSLAEKLAAQVRVVRCGPHRSKIELRGMEG